MATCKCIKKALIRREGYPIGFPAPVYVNCSCGNQVDIEINGPNVTCDCGTVYDNRGYILEEANHDLPQIL